MLIEILHNNKFRTKFLKGLTLLLLFNFLILPLSSFGQKKKFTVVLDAGHGGKDPGNVGNGYREKNIVLKVVKEIGAILQKESDIRVVYTREKDVLIDLWKRGEIANKQKADLFVSVHCDAHTSNAYGSGTFVLGLHANKRNFEVAKKENAAILFEDDYKKRYKGFDPNSPESVIGLTLMQEENLDKSFALASDIQKNFRTRLKRRDRGVKQAGFVVLHQTYMPSVLIELGFLTNKNEGRYLNSKKGQQQLAANIAKSIKKYFEQLRLNTVSTDDVVVVDEKPDEVIKEAVVKNDEVKEEALYKVQIASSKKRIRTKSYNFKGLKNIERVKVGKYYKYYYGTNSSYTEAKDFLQEAKKKGYSSAYIVFSNSGNKVSTQKDAKKNVVENSKNVKNKDAKDGVLFKIQIASSKKKILTKSYNFKGLKNVERVKVGNYYKYYYGHSSNYQTAKKAFSLVKKKGYTTSLLVAFKNGEKVPLAQALK